MPTTLTEPIGIFQSDIIIRTMLVAAIEDLRANPWLLDYVFASLKYDALTAKTYGEKEIERAKEWFKKTKVNVMMGARIPDGDPPAVCITLHIVSSTEEENTLADVHYRPIEDTENNWPALTAKFDPVSYNATTGVMTVPADIAASLVFATGMVVADRTGTAHPILETLSTNSFKLATGIVADFHECFVKAASPSMVATIESASFKESLAVGCHVAGEPVHLTYLHSIIVFALLRYRQDLLEARGFERSFIASTDFKVDEDVAPEMFFSRYVNLVGYVKQYWPKRIVQKVLSTEGQMRVIDGGTAPDTSDLDELAWVGDQDPLTAKFGL